MTLWASWVLLIAERISAVIAFDYCHGSTDVRGSSSFPILSLCDSPNTSKNKQKFPEN
jgi:hypothetical protein